MREKKEEYIIYKSNKRMLDNNWKKYFVLYSLGSKKMYFKTIQKSKIFITKTLKGVVNSDIHSSEMFD